jgi:hypothetical protein
LLPAAALTVLIAVLAQRPPSGDVAWQLWIGRELSNGASLYRDVIEINPPLWFWLGVPIVRIAALLHLSGTAMLVIWLGICAGVSLAFVRKLSPTEWPFLGTVLALVFFVAGISATGQREQFTLITVTPYIFLCARRVCGKSVELPLALAIGAWAALGLCLKPYFVMLPLLMEAWLARREGLRLRPELVAIAAIAIAYAATVAIIYPEYWSTVLPLVRQNYGAYEIPLTSLILSAPVLISLYGSLALLFMTPRSDESKALAVAGLAFLLCYLIQAKGWRYQGFPAIGCFVTVSALAIRQLPSAALGALALFYTLATTNSQESHVYAPTMAATRDLKAGSSILVLSAYADPAWPMVEIRQFRWSSPYMFLWMSNNRNFLVSAAINDIQRHPMRILVDRRLDLVREEPIRAGLRAYSQGPTYGRFDSFNLTTSLSAEKPSSDRELSTDQTGARP